MKTSISELFESVLAELRRLNYSKETICQYERAYKRYDLFAQHLGITVHSVELGDKWLLEGCGIDIANIDPGSPKRQTRLDGYNVVLPTRAIQCLNEWMLFQHIPLKKQGKLYRTQLCPGLDLAFQAYKSYCRTMGYSEPGTYSRLNRIKRMLIFFESRGIHDLSEIGAPDISDFIKTQIDLQSRTVASMLTAIRCFFKEVYLQGFTKENLYNKVPSLKANRNFKLPKIWKTSDVQKLLVSIDRDNPTGKRDYAILLMITRYGLRSLDIRRLKLFSFDWVKGTLNLVQSKTGRLQTLPLLHDVGWAVAEYLRYGRPKFDSEYVFLTHTVPYRPFGIHSSGLNEILAKRAREAGIVIPREVSKGVHALRHTLASTLLSQDIPLPVISSVLGHATMEATAIYLHTDLIRLKDCVLDPEEVLHASQQ
ncbi:MAG: site-specific integrase [Sphaerochaeta sp.]|jgi:site-specific recombinase XerD|uniref:site-specific integrase n=1 Tax=Sphaerochaeta sp. TaxID=1972642 RepID=UPI0025905036|nr:site-specific integrase [Sphaerochaeta sp.]MDD3058859.1 site-specific integrase [Sphaerochaeta sp.]MDD4039158.1 site-specific integrase [Sphaerochaeta sp.]MDX9985701.1 site-specific integrase [Sphaerochaeta sp.]